MRWNLCSYYGAQNLLLTGLMLHQSSEVLRKLVISTVIRKRHITGTTYCWESTPQLAQICLRLIYWRELCFLRY